MISKKSVNGNKYQKNRLFVLSEQWVPRLSPALAKEIGLVESVLLLQIEFLIAVSDHYKDGNKWTYQSSTDLREMFPFWSRATINRGIKSLEKKGLIHLGNFNKAKYDRTRWFAINREEASKLKSIRFEDVQIDADSKQDETGSTLEETTIPNTTTNTTTNVTTDITTKNKETLSASPPASSIPQTQSSMNSFRKPEKEPNLPPPENVLKPHVKSPRGKDTSVLKGIDPASQVFNDWREVMEYPDAVFNNKYRTAVASRLKEGYSVDDLKLAIRGILFSKFHTGKNETKTVYDNLELICRDGTKVEKFKNLAIEKGIESNDKIRKCNFTNRRHAATKVEEPYVFSKRI